MKECPEWVQHQGNSQILAFSASNSLLSSVVIRSPSNRTSCIIPHAIIIFGTNPFRCRSITFLPREPDQSCDATLHQRLLNLEIFFESNVATDREQVFCTERTQRCIEFRFERNPMMIINRVRF